MSHSRVDFESCIDCVSPKRHPGCHAKCEAFKRDKEKYERRKEHIRNAKKLEEAFNTFEIEQIARHSKDKRYLHEH